MLADLSPTILHENQKKWAIENLPSQIKRTIEKITWFPAPSLFKAQEDPK